MNPYIITLIGIGILAPVIYFVPSGLTRNGKWILLIASFIIAETGVLALNIIPYWQAAVLLLLLIVISSYLLHNRAGSIFMNSAALESAAAKQKNEETVEVDHKESSLSDSGTAEGNFVLVKGTSHPNQPKLPLYQSMKEEAETQSEIEPFKLVMVPGEGVELEDPDKIPIEVVEEHNIRTATSVEFEESDIIQTDNVENILDEEVETEEMGYIEESEEYPFLETADYSLMLSDLAEEEGKNASSEEIEAQEEGESYLASIEKMLEVGDLDDIVILDSDTESLTEVNRSEAADELESFTDVLEEEEEDSDNDLLPIPEDTLSVLEAQSEPETLEEMPAAVEEEHIPGVSDEGTLASTAENLPVSSQQELNTLIIDSLKFAKYEMGSDNYMNLLENQLEKELPVQMHYEIALMLMNAYFKAGRYTQFIKLLEEMNAVYGHLPAVSLELETLFTNVKKFIQ